MNCDLHDIQDDIQKLAKQQNQIQVQAMQAQQLFQAQQIANILNQQYSSQQNIAGLYHPIQQQFGSTPHLPMKPPPHHQYVNDQGQYINQQIYSRENSRIEDQYATVVSTPPTQYLNQEKQRNIAKYVQETNNYRDQFDTQQAQFFLHQDPQTPPQPPARRTWSQKAPAEMSSWSQQAQQIQQQQLYQQQPSQQQQQQQTSWKSSSSSASQSEKGFVLHQNGKASQEAQAHRLFPVQHATPTQQQNPPIRKVPHEEVMAPQSISFIGEEENDDEPDNFNHSRRMDDLEVSLGKLNITSGSRTYRIPSPTTRNHPGLAVNSFQSIESQNDENEKGFYISFDGDTQPKRPKPPLRTKRSPKKRPVDDEPKEHQDELQDYEESFKPMPDDRLKQVVTSPRQGPFVVNKSSKENEALIIGDEVNNSGERISAEEMEKRKEKIMLLSLQRRQQQEEAKARKEIEAMQRRERESMKDDEKARKKEDMMARRQQILEQHRLKKAVEEAEREGKTLDRHTAELLRQQQQNQHMSTPQPKMRTIKSQRPRPKTIHVETGSTADISGALGKKGSTSNLTGEYLHILQLHLNI